MRSTKIMKNCSSSLCTCLHHMVILRTRNKITDFFMILSWAGLFNIGALSLKKKQFSVIFISSCQVAVRGETSPEISIVYYSELTQFIRRIFCNFQLWRSFLATIHFKDVAVFFTLILMRFPNFVFFPSIKVV